MLRVLIPMLLVLGLSEMAVRAMADSLPARLGFHSEEADIKLSQMDRLQADGGVDIVTIGNSLVTAGLLPDVIEEELDGPRVYNAGLAAASPMLLETWLVDVVIPRLTPDIVVIGLSTFDLSDAPESFEFVKAFEESPAGKKVVGREGVLDRLNNWVGDRSALWRHRQSLRNPTTWKNAVFLGAAPVDLYTRSISADGANRPEGEYRFETRRADNGPRVDDWALGTENRAALLGIIDAVVASGAQPVLVNMPVTEYYIETHPNGSDSLAKFRTELNAIAREASTPLLDYENPDTDYFADAVHLNSWGAEAFSKAFVADLLRVVEPILDGRADPGDSDASPPSDPRGEVTGETPSSTPGASLPSSPTTVVEPGGGEVVPDPADTPSLPQVPPVTLPDISLPPVPEVPPVDPDTDIETPDIP